MAAAGARLGSYRAHLVDGSAECPRCGEHFVHYTCGHTFCGNMYCDTVPAYFQDLNFRGNGWCSTSETSFELRGPYLKCPDCRPECMTSQFGIFAGQNRFCKPCKFPAQRNGKCSKGAGCNYCHACPLTVPGSNAEQATAREGLFSGNTRPDAAHAGPSASTEIPGGARAFSAMTAAGTRQGSQRAHLVDLSAECTRCGEHLVYYLIASLIPPAHSEREGGGGG